MAGDAGHGGPKPPGSEKFFNSFTATGRRNCTVATLASVAALVLYFKLKPSSKK